MWLDSPAKINLFLHVTGRRADGYHELSTLMCGITLYDRIELEMTSGLCELTCTDPSIPQDEGNLALRAARLFMKEAGQKGGVRIRLEKNIPAGAGLGGGSGNAAMVLTGMNRLCGEPFSEKDLMRMGLGLGADVPFFVRCRPALATGIGEKLQFCTNIKPYQVVVLFAGEGVSTAGVYKRLNLGLTKSEKRTNSRLLNEGQFDPVPYLHNDLEAPAQTLDEKIVVLKGLVAASGAQGTLMTGSGSAVFGLYSDSAAAEEAIEKIKTQGQALGSADRLKVLKAEMIM